MNQLREKTYAFVSSTSAALKQLHYLRLVFVLLAGFTLTNLGVIVFAQSTRPTQPSPNPFLEYADMFPGNPLSLTHTKAFSCSGSNNYYIASEVTCRFSPDSSMFSEVAVIISNGAISQTTFTLHNNTLKVGDLAFLFASPNFQAYPRKVFFFWSNLFVIVSTTANGNHASIRPVWSVTFSNRY